MNNTWKFCQFIDCKYISGLVQHDIYSKAPITDIKLRLPNLSFTSFICSSVVGQSFLLGMKLVGKSTSSENEESSVCSISSGSQFLFNLDGSILIENIALGVHSSFEKYPIRVNQLSEFKIKQEEGFQHNEQHLDRLILSSLKVPSGKLKRYVTHEGMYGFVSKYHVKWIDFLEISVSQY